MHPGDGSGYVRVRRVVERPRRRADGRDEPRVDRLEPIGVAERADRPLDRRRVPRRNPGREQEFELRRVAAHATTEPGAIGPDPAVERMFCFIPATLRPLGERYGRDLLPTTSRLKRSPPPRASSPALERGAPPPPRPSARCTTCTTARVVPLARHHRRARGRGRVGSRVGRTTSTVGRGSPGSRACARPDRRGGSRRPPCEALEEHVAEPLRVGGRDRLRHLGRRHPVDPQRIRPQGAGARDPGLTADRHAR